MAKYLVTFSDELNDIEVNGLRLMTSREMEYYEELASSIPWMFSFKIGDAELEFSSGDDLLSKMDFREISNEEYKILKKLLKEDFGTFVGESFLETLVDDTEEKDISDDDSDYNYDFED